MSRRRESVTTNQTSPAPTTSPTISSHQLNSAFTVPEYRERRGREPRPARRYTSADARLHPEPDRLHARAADGRLVRDRLRPRSGRRLPAAGPPREAGRRGPGHPRQRDDHRRHRGADRRARLPRDRPVGALYKNDPVKVFLPPYSGLGVYGGIITGTIAAYLYTRYKKAPFLRWADIVAPGPVRDAGDRPLGQLLQPGAVRVADDAAVGHPDRMRPPHRATSRAPSTRSRPPASTRCSCTSRSPGAIGALVLIWIGYHLRKRLRPGDLLLSFFVWYGLTRFVLETLRHDNWTFFGVPTAQVVSLGVRHPGDRHPAVAASRPADRRRPADLPGRGDLGRHRPAGRSGRDRRRRRRRRGLRRPLRGRRSRTTTPTTRPGDDDPPTSAVDEPDPRGAADPAGHRRRAESRAGRPADGRARAGRPDRAAAGRRPAGSHPRRWPPRAAAPSRASPGSDGRRKPRRPGSCIGCCAWSPGS